MVGQRELVEPPLHVPAIRLNHLLDHRPRVLGVGTHQVQEKVDAHARGGLADRHDTVLRDGQGQGGGVGGVGGGVEEEGQEEERKQAEEAAALHECLCGGLWEGRGEGRDYRLLIIDAGSGQDRGAYTCSSSYCACPSLTS